MHGHGARAVPMVDRCAILGRQRKARAMADKALKIELGEDQKAILQRQLESGRYEDASDVVNDALRLLDERDADLDEWLRQEVQESLADKAPPIPMEDVFARLEARHAQRMTAAKRGRT